MTFTLTQGDKNRNIRLYVRKKSDGTAFDMSGYDHVNIVMRANDEDAPSIDAEATVEATQGYVNYDIPLVSATVSYYTGVLQFCNADESDLDSSKQFRVDVEEDL